MEWYQIKLLLEHGTGFSMDALHVVVGVCAHFAAAAILRTSVSRTGPWLIVLLAELANEFSDFYVELWPDWGMQWGEAAKDLLLTMFLPTLILMLTRLTPALFQRCSRSLIPDGEQQLSFDF